MKGIQILSFLFTYFPGFKASSKKFTF